MDACAAAGLRVPDDVAVLGAVERMLADRNVRIESIAQMCGYRSDVNLKKQFKNRFGLSMREWRSRGW